jgi:hypothetical protein
MCKIGLKTYRACQLVSDLGSLVSMVRVNYEQGRKKQVVYLVLDRIRDQGLGFHYKNHKGLNLPYIANLRCICEGFKSTY